MPVNANHGRASWGELAKKTLFPSLRGWNFGDTKPSPTRWKRSGGGGTSLRAAAGIVGATTKAAINRNNFLRIAKRVRLHDTDYHPSPFPPLQQAALVENVAGLRVQRGPSCRRGVTLLPRAGATVRAIRRSRVSMKSTSWACQSRSAIAFAIVLRSKLPPLISATRSTSSLS